MAELLIRDEQLIGQLMDAARRRQQSVENLLQDLLMIEERHENDDDMPGSSARLLKAALRANLASPETVDTSERSREILQTEYADYRPQHTDYLTLLP